MNIEQIQNSINLEPDIEDSDDIGRQVVDDYETDLQSRSEWEKNMREAMDLALQVTKDKAYPWTQASNVKFPLLTIAALQFASRVYPALVKVPDLVKYRVQGSDPDGKKAARAGRISAHMSYQLLEEDEDWEEQQDRAFIALPILGCVFKKSYRGLNGNKSTFVLPQDLIVHYYARSLEECERKTERFQLYEREIRERVLSGIYSDKEFSTPSLPEQTHAAKRQGLSPPPTGQPRTFLEQHCFLDLDEDQYPEPYVVTVDLDTKQVVRIVARFGEVVTEQSVRTDKLRGAIRELFTKLPKEGNPQDASAVEQTIRAMQSEIEMLSQQRQKVLRITPVEYYTKYSFIPSPDGGFYDLGFGALLGPLNKSVDSLINQLIDSGTLQNGSVGFIGRGARIKGGKVSFSPNEWKRVDVAGSTLRDSLVPLPVNPPSQVLFNLLGLLIQYTERVASVTDTNMGENPGQNTPAYNMSAMLEQGLQVFNGIFKRVYRSFRKELRKLYALNSQHMEPVSYFEYQDSDQEVLKSDYDMTGKDLIPAADPNAFANKERQMKASIVAQKAMSTPGYDLILVEQLFLEAHDIPNAAEIYPVVRNPETGVMELKYPPQPNPEFQIESLKEQRLTLESQARAEREGQLAASRIAVDEAQIIKLMADANVAADKPGLERMKLLLDDLESQRKSIIEVAKIENAARTDRRVEK